MMTGNHRLKQDGTVTARGIDYGGRVTLVFRAGDFIVTRNRGAMCWSGIGSQEYTPSEWSLLQVMLPSEVKAAGPPWYDVAPKSWDGLEFQVVEVLSEETPGAKWRACRDKLILKAKESQAHASLRRT